MRPARAGLSVASLAEDPVHAAAGASYDLVQQRLLELPSSTSRAGHIAGALCAHARLSGAVQATYRAPQASQPCRALHRMAGDADAHAGPATQRTAPASRCQGAVRPSGAKFAALICPLPGRRSHFCSRTGCRCAPVLCSPGRAFGGQGPVGGLASTGCCGCPLQFPQQACGCSAQGQRPRPPGCLPDVSLSAGRRACLCAARLMSDAWAFHSSSFLTQASRLERSTQQGHSR